MVLKYLLKIPVNNSLTDWVIDKSSKRVGFNAGSRVSILNEDNQCECPRIRAIPKLLRVSVEHRQPWVEHRQASGLDTERCSVKQVFTQQCLIVKGIFWCSSYLEQVLLLEVFIWIYRKCALVFVNFNKNRVFKKLGDYVTIYWITD